MPRKKRVTIYDIAKKLNLTASSVSRALNNSNSVNPVTKKRILAAAEELHYIPNTLASALRKGESRTLGVVVPRINQNFFSNVIAGIEQVTYKQGYNIIICQSNESVEKEILCINTLINQHVDGIVISVCAEGSDYGHLQHVLDQEIPLIQFDRVCQGLSTFKVINDNELASFQAVSHLIAQGYTKIALLEGPQNLITFQQRKKGYLNALSYHGIPVNMDYIVKNAWTKELGAVATKLLLALPEAPDAIFASTSDFSALGVLEVASAMAIQVPAQLGICGYSNEGFTEITSPSITTIDQFSLVMGQTIAELFFSELLGKSFSSHPREISIMPELIIRGSTSRGLP